MRTAAHVGDDVAPLPNDGELPLLGRGTYPLTLRYIRRSYRWIYDSQSPRFRGQEE